ncbi:uncharacterized protein Z518_06365 [Rhinocladiella mackenziei CBS 650.93]|uniref:Rhinocladiella mackenziei CBS 650.93 unplaced genomic scaffold supercont1.4, whole genome shotgun sequence n=1 Tax=Rhinocladiella mackenziei CBS 650.93 TaxID=1442369 RepID=A0A0D2H523_9EURO|nr:uncharacterized protein Z518_06365 [Rhinocladiella mackenziei CBS 650.93]KIX05493.1 hypothetical protein Z518_06365 [Rhinocladiella mackenziei CBS 650.93]
MSPSTKEKTNAVAETSSIRSTSTMSSLKALLPTKRPNKEEKPRLRPETIEQKALRREASAAYMAMK